MGKWAIYHKDGSVITDINGEQILVGEPEYSGSWMGDCFLTVDISNPTPIMFEIGDYIIYRGERFELNYDPGKDKKARKDTCGDGFKYNSVRFSALQDEMMRSEFLDVVLNDNNLHYTALPKFSFYVETIDDLLDRIQANLDEQIGKGMWKLFSSSLSRSVQRGCTESEWKSVYGSNGQSIGDFDSKSLVIDSKNCWDALALVNTEWDINFIVRNRNVYIETEGVITQDIFKYGIGKGLYEVDQNADPDQSIITRLRAYGSDKNLPDHYYADLGIKYKTNITKVITAASSIEFDVDLDYIETYFTTPRVYRPISTVPEQTEGFVLKVTFDYKTIITGFVRKGDNNKCRFYSEPKNSQQDNGDEESKEAFDTFLSQVKGGNKLLYISSGVNKDTIPYANKEYANNLPNNMSINRLMLPGFPYVSLKEFYDSLTDNEKKYVNPSGRKYVFSIDKYRPYIDSVNLEKIGMRSGSQYFDTEDKTNGIIEIYPTIEEMVVNGVRVDEIYTGTSVDDDGRYDTEAPKNIDIYLNPAIDFDINDLRDDDFTISMKDGMCGGREFKVASTTKDAGKWRLTIERSKDDALGLYFPYKDFQINSGDHFVLTGIKLPDSYIKAASLKLLKYAIALLDKNDYTRYVYQPKVDEIFMARQHDLAVGDKTGTIKSLHDTLKEGDVMQIFDEDFGIDAKIIIDQLTIKEHSDGIPTYDVTLREDKEVGTIQKIQQQIDTINSGGSGSGISISQVNSQIASEGRKHFLSKTSDDTAQGRITFSKGMTSDGDAQFNENISVNKKSKFREGLDFGDYSTVSGGTLDIDKDGRSTIVTDKLRVRMKAYFEQLEIMNTETIGGKLVISPVGSNRLLRVNEATVTYNGTNQKAYRCYFLGEQDGEEVENKWKVGDQARTQTFNLTDNTNRYYWRLVIGASASTTEIDGKKYHYVDLSDVDCDTNSDIPAVGDVMNQLGNRTDKDRQSALIFSSVEEFCPSVTLCHGIKSFSLAGTEYVEYGVNHQTNKAFFNVFGDAYFGDRPTASNNYEGTSYITYDGEKKKITIKGDLSVKSTIGGTSFDDYIKGRTLSEDDVNSLISNSQVIEDLQNQIDGAIETWYYEGVPTLTNQPASTWTDNATKNVHLGDLYYDKKTGKAYRFMLDGSTYKWTAITDEGITKALASAEAAQETADGKMTVFSTKADVLPTPPYQSGDIWVNATYKDSSVDYKNDILRCVTRKAKGSVSSISDWTPASKYTDDTVANEAKESAKAAKSAADAAQASANSLSKTVADFKSDYNTFIEDGVLTSAEIQALQSDGTRIHDAYNAAKNAFDDVYTSTLLITDNGADLTIKQTLKTKFTELTAAKDDLVGTSGVLVNLLTNWENATKDGKVIIRASVDTRLINFSEKYDAFYAALAAVKLYISEQLHTDIVKGLERFDYLTDVLLDGSTDVKGGLVLTNILALRNLDNNITSGISGIVDTSKKGDGIAAWWGGPMADLAEKPDSDTNLGNYATSLIRFDGTGYFANGAISWDADGNLNVNPASFIINKQDLGLYVSLFDIVMKKGHESGSSWADIAYATPMVPFSYLKVSDYITIGDIKVSYDDTNGALKVERVTTGKEASLYATGGISALGNSTTSGGGGGFGGSVASYASIMSGSYTDSDLSTVPNAYSIKALSDRIDAIGGSVSVYVPSSGNALTGVTKDGATLKFTTGTFLTEHQSLAAYAKKATTLAGYGITDAKISNGVIVLGGNTITPITAHQSLSAYLTKSDASTLYQPKGNYLTEHQSLANYLTKASAASTYLPLTGGTMIGNMYVSYNTSIIQKQADVSNYTNFVMWYKNGVSQGRVNPQIGQHNTGGDGTGSICILPYAYDDNKEPWGGNVGLFIQKGSVKIDGTLLSKEGHTHNYLSTLKVGGTSYSVSSNSITIPAYPTTLPASDVYAWAKASTKPSYTFSEIGSKPTSLSGYGITDGVNTVSVTGSGNAVTSASVSGHTLTLTKGATFLTTSNYNSYTVTKTGSGASGTWGINITGNASSATKLATARTISLTGGATGSSSFDGTSNVNIPITSISEGYLSWGGPNKSGTFGPIDGAMIPALGANRFAFGKAEGITIEYTRNGGATWTDYGTSDLGKVGLFGNGYTYYVGKADSSNLPTKDYMLRVIIDTDKFGLYTVLNKFAIYVSTDGSLGCYCTIEASLESTPNSWKVFADKVSISGWSGWNIINIPSLTTYGNSSLVQYGLIRITFGITTHNSTYSGLKISKIMGFGGVGWAIPSIMAGEGHLYSYDNSQNAYFPADVSATHFNGTATSANKLTTSAGSTTQPVYFSNGVPVAINPSNLSVGYATSAGKVTNALSWSGYSTGSYDGSSAKSISIPSNTNQLTNGAGFITSSASITGNAGSATKLQTARTLWGQSFNGSANVSGAMTGVTTIAASGQVSVGSLKIGDITITYDATKKALKITGGGLYAETYISALGTD